MSIFAIRPAAKTGTIEATTLFSTFDVFIDQNPPPLVLPRRRPHPAGSPAAGHSAVALGAWRAPRPRADCTSKWFTAILQGEAGPNSDVDLLVEFARPTGLLALVRLERELTEVLGRSVDLLTEEAISPHLRERILREQRVLYEAAH
jgi:predicted nucleotidyltransferase